VNPGVVLLRDFHRVVVGEQPERSLVDVLRLEERPGLVEVLRLQQQLSAFGAAHSAESKMESSTGKRDR
jgi:hypothetical protein